MPVTMISGLTDDFTILSNQRKPDMDPVIAQLEDDRSLICPLVMQFNTKQAISTKVEWLEDELHPRYTTAAGAFTNVATTVNVAANTGAYFKANDVIRDELTGENMLVSSVTGDALTVVRGIGSVVGTASSGAADGIIRVSNAALQGQGLPTMKQTKKVAQYNYTQIIRTSAGFTRSAAESQWFGQDDPVAYEKGKKILEHSRELENTTFLGRRNLITSGANPQGFFGGITDYIATNTSTISGNITQVNLENFLRSAFRYGNRQNKLFVCAPVIMSGMASFPLGRLAPPSPDLNKWGVGGLKVYEAGSGATVSVLEHVDWDDFAKTSPALGGSGFVLDMGFLQWRPLHATTLEEDRQPRDVDAVEFEFLTEAALVVKHERAHGWIRGVTGF